MRNRLVFADRPIIDGLDVDTGETFDAVNPATLERFAKVHRAGTPEIDAAVAAAKKAFLNWGKRPVRERERHLRRLLETVRKNAERIARLIATEQGKPIGEARAVDLVPAADTLRYLSRNAERLLAPRSIEYEQLLFSHKSGAFRFEPLGVIAVITPWNYPFGITFVEVAACLA